MNINISKKGLIVLSILLIVFNIQAQDIPVKNIILMIGDGMGVSQVYAGMSVSKDKLNFERAQYIGFVKTYSTDNYTTDSGASGTAFATGTKTRNKYVGVDSNGVALKSILKYAEENDKSTGLVTTCDITHATPASFYANNISRYNEEEIAVDLLSVEIDVIIAGGRARFDKLGLLDSLTSKGYKVSRNYNAVKESEQQPVACFVANEHPKSILEGRDPKYLETAVEKAMNKLNANEKGFFLMVESSQIDWGGHDNDLKYVVTEVLDFDKAIGKALDFADNNPGTLVIITADHETGALSLLDGDIEKRIAKGMFHTDGHSGVMVPIFTYGAGAENFSQIMENSDVFYKMMDAFGFDIAK